MTKSPLPLLLQAPTPLPTSFGNAVRRFAGQLALAVWVLFGLSAMDLSAQTASSVDLSSCSEITAADGVEVEYEFDQTLGTSQDIDPFGPTPHEVVAQMIKMAKVTKDDVVYDLGSGDGRIPIAAAKQAGARGVGIELRSELVEESRETAEREGVADRVKFVEADFFANDLSDATVVMLYLYPRTLLKLRSKLLSELPVGARIVAYNYGIEGWPRDDEQPVDNAESYFNGTLYYWVVPANVSGVWEGSIETELGETHSFTLQLSQCFQKVSGKVLRGEREMPLKDVQLSGDTLRFTIDLPGDESLQLVATADGHQMKGHARRSGPETQGQLSATRMQWQASRDPATQTSNDPAQN